jgi:DNA-binding MarR family transcriptional regulator
MVKKIDELNHPQVFDHVGWDLMQAAELWHRAFTAEMVNNGCGWYAEARGAIFRFIGPDGIRQSELQTQMNISKQAIQQLLDQLEADGITERKPDESDSRAKRIFLAKNGIAAKLIANQAKHRIENLVRKRLGSEKFNALRNLLEQVSAGLSPSL